MGPEYRIDPFHAAVLHHKFGTPWHKLLSELMDEDDVPRQLLPELAQYFRDMEQAGGVDIVAACMHDSVYLRTVGHFIFLMDRERIEVGTEGDGLPRFTAAEGSDHAAFPDFSLHFKSERLQEGGDLLRCIDLVEGKLWIHM